MDEIKLFKIAFQKICLVFAITLLMVSPNFAANKIQPLIVEDVKNIAYGAGLVKFCPLLSPTDYVSFVQDLLMAERLVNFEHGGDYKFIFKNQEIAAQKTTMAGQDCNDNVLNAIINAEILMKKFISISPLRDELIIAHPQQPKLNQAFIFASFLQVRLAWIYQRKCHILNGAALDEFNALVLNTQTEMKLVFRPEQVRKLNARLSERQYSAIIQKCNHVPIFIDYAIEMMRDDIPNALNILKQF